MHKTHHAQQNGNGHLSHPSHHSLPLPPPPQMASSSAQPLPPTAKSVKILLKPPKTKGKGAGASTPGPQANISTSSSTPAPGLPAQPIIPPQVLAEELPNLGFSDQIPLPAILDRVVQDAYARLVELSETLPGTQPHARAREVDAYAVETRKQFVKMFVISRWAKAANDVDMAMNINQFLSGQTEQTRMILEAFVNTRISLGGARLRNSDISTALTVLTQPPSQQISLLPSIIRQVFEPSKPLKKSQIRQTLLDMNDVLRVRLRMWEIVPMEWLNYRVDNGRVYFTAAGLFSASFSLTGSEANDIWYIIDMEFLCGMADDDESASSARFPRRVPPHLWAQILPGVNAQLVLNAEPPGLDQDPNAQTSADGIKTQVPIGVTIDPLNDKASMIGEHGSDAIHVVDAPLVRTFNLLQMLSLSYQLEILLHQAESLRPFGWGEHLKIDVTRDRRAVNIQYWIRKTPYTRPPNVPASAASPPLYGGILSITITTGPRTLESSSSITPTLAPTSAATSSTLPSSTSSSISPLSSPNLHVSRFARQLEERCTLDAIARSAVISNQTSSISPLPGKGKGKDKEPTVTESRVPAIRASDQVEEARLLVRWEPAAGALAIRLPDGALEGELALEVDPTRLDCERLIKTCVRRHARAVLRSFRDQIRRAWQRYVSSPDGVVLLEDDDMPALRLTLFQDHMLYISIDPRTGRFVLRDSGDLVAWERGYRFTRYMERLNDNPAFLLSLLVGLRLNTICEELEHHIAYIGLRSSRQIGLFPQDVNKLGTSSRMHLFLSLASFADHYIVIVVTEEGFKYALINTRRETVEKKVGLVIADLGWLDPEKLGLGPINPDFTIRPDVLSEIYAFGCARVSHTRVESQLKAQSIPYTSIFPRILPYSSDNQRNRAVPVLRVYAHDLWPNTSPKAADATLDNVKISLLNWWNAKQSRIVTEVKLRSPPPLSMFSSRSRPKVVSRPGIHPNTFISYNPRTSVVSFVSNEPNSSLVEFLAEWNRVRKTLAIARHVAHMSKRKGFEDVRLLSYDLLAVEFTYHSDYVVAIEYIPPTKSTEPLTPVRGSFKASFSRLRSAGDGGDAMAVDEAAEQLLNPHQEASAFFATRIIEGSSEVAGKAMEELIVLLRSTLAILSEFTNIRDQPFSSLAPKSRTPRVNFVVKGAAWFRIFFDLHHALDIRMLQGGHVALLDASFSVFDTPVPSPLLLPPSSLQPIPGFPVFVDAVVEDLARLSLSSTKTSSSRPIAYAIGHGLRCTEGLAPTALRRLYERVLESLIPS